MGWFGQANWIITLCLTSSGFCQPTYNIVKCGPTRQGTAGSTSDLSVCLLCLCVATLAPGRVIGYPSQT